jgi:hypothetical protein
MVKLASDMMNFDGPLARFPFLMKRDNRSQQVTTLAVSLKAAGCINIRVLITSHTPRETPIFSSMPPVKTFKAHIPTGGLSSTCAGLTTHHSIVEFQNQWYLFYHDTTLSGGFDNKRNIKMAEIFYNVDGSIKTVFPEE